ncbi:hypothetical protein Efla_003239 [Eimeria flavescens]
MTSRRRRTAAAQADCRPFSRGSSSSSCCSSNSWSSSNCSSSSRSNSSSWTILSTLLFERTTQHLVVEPGQALLRFEREHGYELPQPAANYKSQPPSHPQPPLSTFDASRGTVSQGSHTWQASPNVPCNGSEGAREVEKKLNYTKSDLSELWVRYQGPIDGYADDFHRRRKLEDQLPAEGKLERDLHKLGGKAKVIRQENNRPYSGAEGLLE